MTVNRLLCIILLPVVEHTLKSSADNKENVRPASSTGEPQNAAYGVWTIFVKCDGGFFNHDIEQSQLSDMSPPPARLI